MHNGRDLLRGGNSVIRNAALGVTYLPCAIASYAVYAIRQNAFATKKNRSGFWSGRLRCQHFISDAYILMDELCEATHCHFPSGIFIEVSAAHSHQKLLSTTILQSGPFNTTTFPPGPESKVRFLARSNAWIGVTPICARMAVRRSVGAVPAMPFPQIRRNFATFRDVCFASPKTLGSCSSAFQMDYVIIW